MKYFTIVAVLASAPALANCETVLVDGVSHLVCQNNEPAPGVPQPTCRDYLIDGVYVMVCSN